MNDANVVRGQAIFQSMITLELPNIDSESSNRLKSLSNFFYEKVGIMPIDGLYAAKRMATACFQSAVKPLDNIQANIKLATELYNQSESKLSTNTRIDNDMSLKNRGTSIEGYDESADDTHKNITKNLANDISSGDVRLAEVFHIIDEDGGVHELDAEVIDLIDDVAQDGGLSIEGMRSVGIINSDFDTTKDTVSEIILTSAGNMTIKPENNWRYDKDGCLIISCPKCKAEHIYPMGEGKFGCFDCDEEFLFRHNLGDMN